MTSKNIPFAELQSRGNSRWRLLFRDASRETRYYIGRNSGASIVILDGYISGQHLWFYARRGACVWACVRALA